MRKEGFPPSLTSSQRSKVHRYNFGEDLLGKSSQAIESFLKAEGRLELLSKESLAKQIRQYIYQNSNRKKYVAAAANYLKTKRHRPNKEYDVILVGAGIHAAIFLYTLKKHSPELSILIVEKSEAICATFNRLGDSLVLNSPTFSKVGLDANILQGHFIQVSDFDELLEKPFPTAKHIYELATMVFFHADADILFNIEIEEVRKVRDTYSVSSGDKTISTKSVVLSNGMGEPNKAAYHKDSLSERIIHGDDFISSCYADKTFLEHIKGKIIAVTGAGDTANCVMEYLLPIGYPNHDYGFYSDAPFLPEYVYWVGQCATDVQEFGLANKHRYCHSGGLVEFFWNGETPFDLPEEVWRRTKALIKCVPDKLISLSHNSNGLELVTGSERLQVDLVIDCTGRSNPLSANLLRDPYEFVMGDIAFYGGHWDEDQDQFVVSPPRILHTRKIACKLKDERIFLLGSAGPLNELIEDEEALSGNLIDLEHRTSLTNSKWSLEHTLPRTVAFAKMYADTMSACSSRGGAPELHATPSSFLSNS